MHYRRVWRNFVGDLLNGWEHGLGNAFHQPYGRGRFLDLAATQLAIEEDSQMKASRRQSNNVLEPQADAPIVGTPAMVRKATGDTANRVEPLAIRPTHEDIARRAYQIYEARGGEHGQDWQDWFEAERELRQFLHDVVRNILTAEGVYAAA